MCGVVGAFGQTLPDLSPAVNMMRHRGPNNQGVIVKDNVAMGHMRLSIVDPQNSASNQPFVDEKSGNVLVFNGEIYNYMSLRKSHLAHREFRSNSDTEVLLYLLSDYGVQKTLDIVSGMFAFALYRTSSRDLILGRDPIGKKPLYYTVNGAGTFLFSSEVKGLQALDVELEPSKPAVLNFLFERTFGYGTMSFFEGVKQVEAGALLTVGESQNIQTERYWYPGEIKPANLSFESAVAKFTGYLTTATLTRVPDEVPFAVMLSGGLDSSAISALVARESGRDYIPTISAVYPGDPDDESPYANQVLKMYPKLRPEKVEIPTDHFAEAWQATTLAMEAPTPDGSMISHHLLMRKIHKLGIKVVLSGNGGDEILAGYGNTFIPAGNVAALKQLNFPELKTNVLRETIFHCMPDKLKNAVFGLRHRNLRFLRDSRDLETLETRYRTIGGHDIVSRYALHTLQHWTTPGFVWYEDRNSMASSVEARSPFYDRKLVEFALSLPAHHLIRKGVTKRILRESMRDILPAGIVDRRDKQGFHAPIKVWMNALDRDPLSDRTFIEVFDYLDIPQILNAGFLYRWRILALHVWFRTFWPESVT